MFSSSCKLFTEANTDNTTKFNLPNTTSLLKTQCFGLFDPTCLKKQTAEKLEWLSNSSGVHRTPTQAYEQKIALKADGESFTDPDQLVSRIGDRSTCPQSFSQYKTTTVAQGASTKHTRSCLWYAVWTSSESLLFEDSSVAQEHYHGQTNISRSKGSLFLTFDGVCVCNGAPSGGEIHCCGKFNSNRKQGMKEKRLGYKPELSKVSHLDFSHASQNLHQVKTFIRLEPTGEEEEEKRVRRFEEKQG